MSLISKKIDEYLTVAISIYLVAFEMPTQQPYRRF